jgi:bifunctional pyridoxal-dependent enzyme with beta-cystathionase and maltose regulon repressor activities
MIMKRVCLNGRRVICSSTQIPIINERQLRSNYSLFLDIRKLRIDYYFLSTRNKVGITTGYYYARMQNVD